MPIPRRDFVHCRALAMERLESRLLLAADFGDAPTPYPTLLPGGASHEAVGPTLGAARDVENDGQPTPAADGDGADDDGVTFGELRVGQLGATVVVNVQNAPDGARLDAWIDFNGDGSWGGANERIAVAAPVVEGDNLLAVDVPVWASSGLVQARFRLSTGGVASPGGPAADGEVEDYAIAISVAAAGVGQFEPAFMLPDGPAASWHVITADIDGDGDGDILAAQTNDGIHWLENRGGEGFVSRGAISTRRFYSFVAEDWDGDGDLDVIGGDGPYVAWVENLGDGTFATYELFRSISDLYVEIVTPADFDGDGDWDLLCSQSGVLRRVNILENTGAGGWVLHQLNPPIQGWACLPIDYDADGDLDVVVAGQRFGTVADLRWHENLGGMVFSAAQSLAPLPPGGTIPPLATGLVAGDFNGDGRVDFATTAEDSFSTRTVTVFLNGGASGFARQTLPYAVGGAWIAAADVDGDGDVDLLAAGDDGEAFLANRGGGQFVLERLAPAEFAFRRRITTGDLNGDGVLDLVMLAPLREDNLVRSAVAWRLQIPLVDADYGDAPAPYPTQRTGHGAVHAAGGPRLGSLRDAESDGQPSPAADGEGADDDGAAWSLLQAGQPGGLTVLVEGAPAGARIDAWIDFDGDGSWDGAGERIAGSARVSEGSNHLAFTIPATAVAGPTFARVRISTGGGLGSSGAAADGEVEDYAVTIEPPAASTAEFSNVHTFGVAGAMMRSADVDGDGDPDFISPGVGTAIVVYTNLGDGAFLGQSWNTGASAAQSVRAADADGDGDVDIVYVGSGLIGWLERNSAGGYTARSTQTVSGLQNVFDLADMDGDGDLDAIAHRIIAGGPQLFVLINEEGQFLPGLAVTTPTMRAAGIRAADIDGDGDLDAAVAFDFNGTSGTVAWYENVGAAFVEHNLSPTTTTVARDVAAIDFDGDGDVDLLSIANVGPSEMLVEWWENDGAQAFTRRLIGSTPRANGAVPIGADRLVTADADGDGDLDVFVAELGGFWLFRRETLTSFTKTSFGDGIGTPIAPSLAVADVTGDGRLEVAASPGSSGVLAWFETTPRGDYDRSGMVDAADLALYEATLGQPAEPPGAGADGDRSGAVDAADLAIYEAHVGTAVTPQVLPADWTQNGVIDGSDFLRWQRLLGTTYSSPHANDLDSNGVIDGQDLAIWRRQFNGGPPRTPPAAAAAAVAAPARVADDEPLFAANVILAIESEPAPRPVFAPRPRHALAAAIDAALTVVPARQWPAEARAVASHEYLTLDGETPVTHLLEDLQVVGVADDVFGTW